MDVDGGKRTYPLVNVNKKNYGNIHHAINGKIHYFDWVIFYVAKR